MSAIVTVDASDFTRMVRLFDRLPEEIRLKAFARVMRRMEKMSRTQLVRDVSDHTSAPQKHIRPAMHVSAGVDDVEARLRTRWLSFANLGARATRSGVSLRRRGSIRGAFFATMSNGHRNAFIRAGKARTPIQGLYGPNPAHAVANNEPHYTRVLRATLETHGLPRLMQEIDVLLS